MNIIKSSTQMKSDKIGKSSLETECLFGETVEILDEYFEWVYCKLISDNYYGWINKKSLGKLTKGTHRVVLKRSFIYKEPNPKSETLMYLPMGSNLAVNSKHSGWALTSFIHENKIKIGYVPDEHIVDLTHKFEDWVATAQLLEGTPYKWGGRDTIGIDCSALLQLSYQTYGEILPRNSSQQIKLKKKIVDNVSKLKRGCVIFWDGHVGIMVDRLNCIHANAFHMKTVTEPLNEIIIRMNKTTKILKMMDFN